MQDKDFLYDNAPLVEVIAEIRWALQNVMAPSGVSIDPHFVAFAEDFRAAAANQGFGFVERVVPDNVPLEFVPHNVVFRYRKRQNQWPCLQIGPGVSTVNHVPPYDGWAEFEPHVSAMVDMLLSTYPVPNRYLNLTLIELRYIDGFRERHGMSKPGPFIREHLQLHQSFPDQLLAICDGSLDDVEPSGIYSFPVRIPKNSTGSIQVGMGQTQNEPAVIATFKLQRKEPSSIDLDRYSLSDWFNQAHGTLHTMFEALTSNQTKDLMGPKKAIGGW